MSASPEEWDLAVTYICTHAVQINVVYFSCKDPLLTVTIYTWNCFDNTYTKCLRPASQKSGGKMQLTSCRDCTWPFEGLVISYMVQLSALRSWLLSSSSIAEQSIDPRPCCLGSHGIHLQNPWRNHFLKCEDTQNHNMIPQSLIQSLVLMH